MAFTADEFRQLIEQHQTMVYSIALRIIGETGLAEEVAQDVFLELFRTSAAPAGEDHQRSWLRRVATHRAIDALRKAARQPEAWAEEWTEEAHSEPEDMTAVPGLEWRMEELLRALPEAMRVAVTLRYGESMTPEEIADMLNQPVATVKSHLQRGLRLLRRKAEVILKEYVRESA